MFEGLSLQKAMREQKQRGEEFFHFGILSETSSAGTELSAGTGVSTSSAVVHIIGKIHFAPIGSIAITACVAGVTYGVAACAGRAGGCTSILRRADIAAGSAVVRTIHGIRFAAISGVRIAVTEARITRSNATRSAGAASGAVCRGGANSAARTAIAHTGVYVCFTAVGGIRIAVAVP